MTSSARRTALAAALPPPTGLDVVDLGCGTGDLTRLLLARGARSVLALELDPDRLAAARASVGADGDRAHPDRAHLEQADLEQATLPFEAYDLACCTVLHRLADPVRFGRMVRSGLRQRACLVCAVPGTTAEVLRRALDRAGLGPVSVTAGDTAGDTAIVVATKPPRGGG